MGGAMSIVAPKGRKHLSADALFGLVRSGFATIPDHRHGETDISLTDALMSAFAMFSLKSPSLLAFDKERAEGNLHTIYGIERVPCDTQMREILDPVSPESLRPLFRASFGNSSAAKRLNRWRFWMATTSWPSMARGIFPPRRFTVRRVCTRSTVTGRSRIITRCWAQRLSIRTCVK